jgi:hypothetical protein
MSAVSESEEINDKNKEEISQLIKNKSIEVSYEIVSGKNPKWKEFKRVLFEKKKTNFITCIECEKLITHKKSSGTAPIVSGKCKIKNQPKVDTFFKKKC